MSVPLYTHVVRSHEWIDRRSLALHDAVAAKLEAHPELIRVARENLERWLRIHETAALLEWRRLLDGTSMPELLALLRSPAEDAARLRQSSPFAGVLTPRERQAILDRHDARGA
jgi:type II secretory pathway component PulL